MKAQNIKHTKTSIFIIMFVKNARLHNLKKTNKQYDNNIYTFLAI